MSEESVATAEDMREQMAALQPYVASIKRLLNSASVQLSSLEEKLKTGTQH